MASSAVQVTWALDQTSESILTVAKGIITAATSDNIQPLAIMAAEAFGNTLAICQQTQLVVEKEASRRHTSSMIKFLQARIGYSAHDSSAQLATTAAGVRFLCFAATLLCAPSYFEGALALEQMIRNSAGKNQIMPTISQLQDLLKALEPKLMRAGFADSILGWESYLINNPAVNEDIRKTFCYGTMHPSPDDMEALINAFRMLGRLGEASEASKIVITSVSSGPWIVAFTKWCFGIPPHIVLDDGSVVLLQSGSKVTLRLGKEGYYKMKVESFHDIESPSILWSNRSSYVDTGFSRDWSGMVSIRTYGARSIRRAGPDRGHKYAALIQALLYGLRLVINNLRHLDHVYWQYAIPLIPSEDKVFQTFAEFMDLPTDSLSSEPPALLDSQAIVHLPLVAIHINDLQAQCRCAACRELGTYSPCDISKMFKEPIVHLMADILAFSLFDCTEQIQVFVCGDSYNNSRRSEVCSCTRAIRNILFDDTHSLQTCNVSCILNWALCLIGHRSDYTDEGDTLNWMASSCRGQVVYPAFFDAMTFGNQSFARLVGGPGLLEYKSVTYKYVTDGNSALRYEMRIHDEPVDGPRNLAQDSKLIWRVQIADGCLQISTEGNLTAASFWPVRTFQSAFSALYLPSCAHRNDAKISPPLKQAYYTTPHYDSFQVTGIQMLDLRRKTPVVAVAGNEDLRFLALSGSNRAVIRGRACLQCCIDLCRKASYDYVIA